MLLMDRADFEDAVVSKKYDEPMEDMEGKLEKIDEHGWKYGRMEGWAMKGETRMII